MINFKLRLQNKATLRVLETVSKPWATTNQSKIN